uniref:Uncharacterized protein n=1 Tax=Rhizophora mucronata TaxID=61149 RepID=A0A2P2P0U8_RHIMU
MKMSHKKRFSSMAKSFCAFCSSFVARQELGS